MSIFFSDSEIDENLLKQIYRPPRQSYNERDLGPQVQRFGNINITRQDHQIKNHQGLYLKGSLWTPNNNHDIPIIIFMHGNAGSRLECIPILKYASEYGFGLFGFDFSGCGNSQGNVVTLGGKEVEDCESVMNFLRQLGYRKFVLFGRSMGGVVALKQCAQNSEGIICLILDSVFSSFKRLAEDIADDRLGMASFFIGSSLDSVRDILKQKTGYDFFKLEPYKDAKNCQVPGIFAFSHQDTLVRSHHSDILLKNYAGKKKSINFKGDHNATRDYNYYTNIMTFIQQFSPQINQSGHHQQNPHSHQPQNSFSLQQQNPYTNNHFQKNNLQLQAPHQQQNPGIQTLNQPLINLNQNQQNLQHSSSFMGQPYQMYQNPQHQNVQINGKSQMSNSLIFNQFGNTNNHNQKGITTFQQNFNQIKQTPQSNFAENHPSTIQNTRPSSIQMVSQIQQQNHIYENNFMKTSQTFFHQPSSTNPQIIQNPQQNFLLQNNQIRPLGRQIMTQSPYNYKQKVQ